MRGLLVDPVQRDGAAIGNCLRQVRQNFVRVVVKRRQAQVQLQAAMVQLVHAVLPARFAAKQLLKAILVEHIQQRLRINIEGRNELAQLEIGQLVQRALHAGAQFSRRGKRKLTAQRPGFCDALPARCKAVPAVVKAVQGHLAVLQAAQEKEIRVIVNQLRRNTKHIRHAAALERLQELPQMVAVIVARLAAQLVVQRQVAVRKVVDAN